MNHFGINTHPHRLMPYRWFVLAVFSGALHLFLIIPYGLGRLLPEKTPTAEEPSPKEEWTFMLPEDPITVETPTVPTPPTDKKPTPTLETKSPPIVEILPKQVEVPKRVPPKFEETKIPPIDAHKKMVEQSRFPDEKDHPDAEFLASKNHRVDKQTQALQTNLEKDQRAGGPKRKPQATRTTQERAAASTPQRATLPQASAHTTAKPTPVRQAQEQTRRQVLGFHEPSTSQVATSASTRSNTEEPSTAHPTAPKPSQTNSAREFPKGPFLPAGPLAPSSKALTEVIGEGALAAQGKAAREYKPLATPGAYESFVEETEAFRSSIENFTPGIEVGSETNLGTRSHPFASYIAAMHRRIHTRWALTYLASMGPSASIPADAEAKVLIVLNEDGTLCTSMLTKVSGYHSFDMAAVSSVSRSAPFPKPPSSLHSPNGKIYVTWSFFRDHRQCATDFTDAHILKRGPEVCTAKKKEALREEQSQEETKASLKEPGGTPSSILQF